MIPPFVHSRIFAHNPLVTWAVLVVIIDNPTSLQMGVDRHCTDVFKTAFLQVLADPVRQTVTDRDWSGSMALIQNCLIGYSVAATSATGMVFMISTGMLSAGMTLTMVVAVSSCVYQFSSQVCGNLSINP